MSPEKVFQKGDAIKSLNDLKEELEKNNWVYLRDTPKHPSIILNMNLGTVLGFLRFGLISYAKRRNSQ